MNYETVIGLEVHVELLCRTKIFCSCESRFGGEPNTRICEVCTGMPGTLPRLNEKTVEFAVKTGLATNCKITEVTRFDRKNYFYPDLPKAYQISQLYVPVCRDGFIEIETDGGKKRIGIHEIHMEEDAGKLFHTDAGKTLIDYNRCGVALLEIVTEPDFSSSRQVTDFLEALRKILTYLGVSDCKMQEGSMRADVNLSVRKAGQSALGTRTEMKNLNSFHDIADAVNSESRRQIELLENGEEVVMQTRRWDADKKESFAMRSKEAANDYRYFPEPDIPPVIISKEYIEKIRAEIPELPDEKKARYKDVLNLSDYDASLLTDDIELGLFFEEVLKHGAAPKEAANLILGEVLRLKKEYPELKGYGALKAEALAALVKMTESGIINRTTEKLVLEKVYCEGVNPEEYITLNKLGQITDSDEIRTAARKVITENAKSVADYKGGKQAAFGYITGQVMKALGGRANAVEVQKILKQLLG